MIAEAAPDVEPKARIFISYSRKDMAFADRLEEALKARGFEPLIDRSEIYAFEDWWKRIQALIGKADTVVFVLSPDAVASEVALKEVTHARSTSGSRRSSVSVLKTVQSLRRYSGSTSFSSMTRRALRRAPIGLRRRYRPTSVGSGNTPSSAKRRGAGKPPAGRGAYCCAPRC
jgi:hypothetical protein